MLRQLRRLLINCQAKALSTFALENIVLLYIDKYDKLIGQRLTIFHHDCMATQTIIFMVV